MEGQRKIQKFLQKWNYTKSIQFLGGFCLIFLILANFLFLNSVESPFSLSTPEKALLIDSGQFSGNLLFQVDKTSLRMLSVNDEVMGDYQLPVEEIGDISLGYNDTVFISDYRTDRILQYSLSSKNVTQWSWDAKLESSINWTNWTMAQTWDLSYKYQFLNETSNPDFSLGICDIQYINSSYLQPGSPSLLVCCEKANIILEITLENPSKILWLYGKENVYRKLNSPTVAYLSPNHDLFVGNSGDGRFIKIEYPNTYYTRYYRFDFPHGYLRRVSSIHWISEDYILVSAKGTIPLFYLNFTSEEPVIPFPTKPLDGAHYFSVSGDQMLFVNYLTSQIYITNSENFSIEREIGQSWKENLILFNLIILGTFLVINSGLLLYFKPKRWFERLSNHIFTILLIIGLLALLSSCLTGIYYFLK